MLRRYELGRYTLVIDEIVANAEIDDTVGSVDDIGWHGLLAGELSDLIRDDFTDEERNRPVAESVK